MLVAISDKVKFYLLTLITIFCALTSNASAHLDIDCDSDLFIADAIGGHNDCSTLIILPFDGSSIGKISKGINSVRAYLKYTVRSIDNKSSIAAIFHSQKNVFFAKDSADVEKDDVIIIPALVHYPVNNHSIKSIAALYGLKDDQLADVYNVSKDYKPNHPIVLPIFDKSRDILIVKSKNINASKNATSERTTGLKSDSEIIQTSGFTPLSGDDSAVASSAPEAKEVKESQFFDYSDVKYIEKPVFVSDDSVSNEKPSKAAKTQYDFASPIEAASYSSNPDGSITLVSGSSSQRSAVRPVKAGKVIYAGDKYREYGTFVMIEHSKNYVSVYLRLASISVSAGEEVKKNTTIGFIEGGSELLLQIKKGDESIDAMKALGLS